MDTMVAVIARVRAARGKAEELAALLVEQAAVVRAKEPRCSMYRVHRSTSDPDLFVFYETYDDDSAFEAHRHSPHIVAFRQRREKEGLAEGPVDVEIIRPLAG